MSVPQPPEPIPGARLLFSLDPAVSHLNHGSFGAAPIGVQRAQQRLRDEMEANPLRFFTQGLVDRIAHTRRHLAGFLGADPDGSALVGNTTTGVAVVLQSLGLQAGDEVLSTDHGYGAVSLSIQRECRRTGAVSRVLPIPLAATDEQIVQTIRAGLRSGRTRLLVVDQLTSATAKLFPTAAIVGVAREHGVPVLVDAAHAPGMLGTTVSSIGADFWVGNLHKWAYAPRGTALLAVAPRWRDRIEPLVVSWEQDSGFPARIEWQATLDYTSWLAAPAGLFTLRSLGVDRVRAHNAALAAYGQRVVGDALGVPPAQLPDPGGPGVSLRLIPLPAGTATTIDAARALQTRIGERLAAEVAVMCWNGRGWLRLAGQVYNTADEYERLAVRLPALLAQR
ncbi:aminotransferase class V-fold PLP-dependent enzyme [Micromonospora parathelypteridis]|uniref:Isopenicillin-N epimerase n=1 Tax=Micromonospora parathelypteridis TaxID=1839617 RepID=A0A840VSE8_9ACTN|nr:aminotransferase class V-fold PLP-dependent enzyme [Micromonospora parathelypteridis]MBB5479625.1 isopenicillin-N epimerase [Micromonospora parathelypteridis]GGO30899.1 aminotransferase class V [Micromonospora parathelypteridis]